MIDPLTLDQMRVLVAVADAGSFSAAARKLDRVQSAISQSIQTLETTLRLNLFDRTGRTPRLTDAGKALVGDARALIGAAQAIRARAQGMADDVEPELTLAVDSMFPIPLLMESLKALRVAFPLLPATVFTEALGGSEQRLRDGAARLAIYTVAARADGRPRNRVHDPDRHVAGGRGRPSSGQRARAADPRSARAARAACAHRSNRADAKLGRRHRQPSPLAVRGSRHPPRFPAWRLWLVQHAEPYGHRAHRCRPAEKTQYRQPGRRSRPADLHRPRARPAAGTSWTLADRRPARAVENMPGSASPPAKQSKRRPKPPLPEKTLSPSSVDPVRRSRSVVDAPRLQSRRVERPQLRPAAAGEAEPPARPSIRRSSIPGIGSTSPCPSA